MDEINLITSLKRLNKLRRIRERKIKNKIILTGSRGGYTICIFSSPESLGSLVSL